MFREREGETYIAGVQEGASAQCILSFDYKSLDIVCNYTYLIIKQHLLCKFSV